MAVFPFPPRFRSIAPPPKTEFSIPELLTSVQAPTAVFLSPGVEELIVL